MRKEKIAVVLLLCLLILGGISPLLSEVTGIFSKLHNIYSETAGIENDGGSGGGGGWPGSIGGGGG